MLEKNRRARAAASALLDILLIAAAFVLAGRVHLVYVHWLYAGELSSVVAMSREPIVVASKACLAVLMVILYGVFGLYDDSRLRRFSKKCATILLVNFLAMLLFSAMLYLRRLDEYSRMLNVIMYVLSCGLVILPRLLRRGYDRSQRRQGKGLRHILLVGGGSTALQYLEVLKENPYYGFHVDGFLCDDPDGAFPVPCFGGYGDLEACLRQSTPDEVVVALEAHEVAMLPRVIEVCDQEGVRITMVPFYNDYLPAHPTIDVLGPCKLINIRQTPFDNVVNAAVKRGMDIVGSLLLIVLTSPVMLAVAVGVKLSSPGPIIFKQERVGLDKKPFMMFKFRSMRVNNGQDTAWSTDVDPRKTKFGSMIRKFSLDELPQFFNVLKGDMSLVGPRPEIPFHVAHFKTEIPRYLVRQQVRPGVTGWAQIHGLRGDTDIAERIRYDIWYIENWSAWLDIEIIFRTVFGGKMVNDEKIN
ncbi:MAG: undecaprenyl-phosphate glucose phosphotransferase [Gemmiger sp.]